MALLERSAQLDQRRHASQQLQIAGAEALVALFTVAGRRLARHQWRVVSSGKFLDLIDEMTNDRTWSLACFTTRASRVTSLAGFSAAFRYV